MGNLALSHRVGEGVRVIDRINEREFDLAVCSFWGEGLDRRVAIRSYGLERDKDYIGSTEKDTLILRDFGFMISNRFSHSPAKVTVVYSAPENYKIFRSDLISDWKWPRD